MASVPSKFALPYPEDRNLNLKTLDSVSDNEGPKDFGTHSDYPSTYEVCIHRGHWPTLVRAWLLIVLLLCTTIAVVLIGLSFNIFEPILWNMGANHTLGNVVAAAPISEGLYISVKYNATNPETGVYGPYTHYFNVPLQAHFNTTLGLGTIDVYYTLEDPHNVKLAPKNARNFWIAVGVYIFITNVITSGWGIYELRRCKRQKMTEEMVVQFPQGDGVILQS